MLGLGTLSFATPLALAALALLPVIWWLLRFTPPRPTTVRFPPFRLLLDLISREEQPDHTPWWLVLLRLAIATLIILAVARPLLSENKAGVLTGDPLLVVVDDGWAAATHWPARQKSLNEVIDGAERVGAPVALAVTAPLARPADIGFKPAAEARERAATIAPRALETARLALLDRLKAELADEDALQVVWLSDGLDTQDAAAFAEGLRGLAGGRANVRAVVTAPNELGLALSPPVLDGGDLKVAVRRASPAAASEALVRLEAANGRSLGERRVRFSTGALSAEGSFELPVELRNEAARLEIADERTAGAVYLFDDLWRRKTVGLVSGASLELDQPLLSPLYYVSRALEPSAELREPRGESLREFLKQDLSMLVLADVGIIPREDRERVAQWVEDGGLLLRFAGPRLAGGNDDLVPVELRSGDRSLGSALSWEQPQGLAQFSEESPFAGLDVDPEVTVTRQVLAEPTPDLQEKVWASLADGTPLITAARRGNGLIVLVHVTANAEWSNLALSGLFVQMLNRIAELAPGTGTGSEEAAEPTRTAGAQEAWTPRQTLNGFGELGAPPADAAPIPARAMSGAKPSPTHPAGLYHRAGASRAINVVPDAEGLRPIAGLPAAISLAGYEIAPALDLSGPLFAAALFLLVADCVAALALSGAFARLRWRRAGAVLLIGGLAGLFAIEAAHAQEQRAAEAEQFAMEAALETRLAYVMTGDRELDEISFAGLSGLSEILRQRTSVEPATPMGVNIERDDIVFFPLLYWPVQPDTPMPSPEALAKIDEYIKNGGTIFLDTRDADTDIAAFAGQPTEATLALRRLLENLDIPPLEPVPPDHVITKAFYLLQSFPGRWANGRLWVESSHSGAAGTVGRADGVSSIIIGSNDYAGAWAIDASGRHLFPAVPGGERQREFAYRTGLNIVMYALTGNYKADQVHVPALLERLGQ